MKKKVFFMLLGIGIIGCSLEAPYEPKEQEHVVSDTTRYIFAYETRNQMEGARLTFEELGYPIYYVAETVDALVVDVPKGKKVLKKFSTATGDEYPALFAEKDEAIYELLFDETTEMSEDTLWMWHSTMIGANKAWENGYKGQGTTIIVIDGGLCEDYKTNPYFSALDTTISYNPYTDSRDIRAGAETDHGSHVFGIIAGQPHRIIGDLYIQGIAPEARMGLIKMFEDRYATRAIALKSLDIAAQYDPDVISMSWGSYSYSPSMVFILERLKEKGIIMAAASGNNANSTVIYPSRYSPVISVGAVRMDTTVAFFSSYGEDLEVVAPGVDILSFKGCSSGEMSGTSMAAPHVSGTIALGIGAVREKSNTDHRLSLNQVRDALWESATPIESERGGFGLIQAMDFVDAINK